MDEKVRPHMSGERIGFIGGGMMASAMIEGLISGIKFPADDIFVAELSRARRDTLRDKYEVRVYESADDFADLVDVLIIAVKPQAARSAMESVSGRVPARVVVVSIVAGLTIGTIESFFGKNPIVRVMPNTPLSVGEGMSAYSLNDAAKETDTRMVRDMLAASGRAVEVPESLMDAVTGLSGSGPAFAFLMIDALSDGGVSAGLPRDTATMMAAQTLLGAAKMVLETGRHPSVLRDQVTSPAGTTIEGVRALEEAGVRGALINAVLRSARRSAELGRIK